MFTISTDASRRLVKISISGLLSADDVDRLYREEHQALRDMGCPIGQQVVIADLTNCPLQFQEVVAAFRTNFGDPSRARKLALVMGKSAARMQARRIIPAEGAALFNTLDEAEAWIAEGQAQRAA